MLNYARNHLFDAPHMVVFPALAVLLSVLAFNLLGDAWRDWLDPRTLPNDGPRKQPLTRLLRPGKPADSSPGRESWDNASKHNKPRKATDPFGNCNLPPLRGSPFTHHRTRSPCGLTLSSLWPSTVPRPTLYSAKPAPLFPLPASSTRSPCSPQSPSSRSNPRTQSPRPHFHAQTSAQVC
jgi:hypothetical protein